MKKLILVFFLGTLSSCDQPASKDGAEIKSSAFSYCGEIIEEKRVQQEIQEISPTYDDIKVHLIDQYCLSCHGAGGDKPELHLKSQVLEQMAPGKPALQSPLYESITSGRMPPSFGISSKRPEILDALQRWIETMPEEPR